MVDPAYAWKVFHAHYSRVRHLLPHPFAVCELGPGDSLATVMIARCYGSEATYLVDTGNFVTAAQAVYEQLAEFLCSKNLSGFDYSPTYSQSDLLEKNHGVYLTGGLRSLRGIPDEAVDFVFSQAVMEHIPRRDFAEVNKELFRLLKKDGCASYRIDLRDHLGGGLHNLKFSSRIWESVLFSSSGFYTNRLRADEIIELIKDVGFKIVGQEFDRWDRAPITRKQLHAEFRHLSDSELLISGLNLVVQK